MRDRLIELLKKQPPFNALNDVCINKFADYLIENGVIVPPCKVGRTVYAIDKRSGLWWKGTAISFYYVNPSDMQIAVAFEDGEVAIYDTDCVFLTREEAEQALKGGVE